MTTINDIQDLVRIIEDRPEWRRELQRVLLTTDMHDTASLITETAKLAAKNAESIAANAEATAANTKSIDRLETTVAETAGLVAKNSESIDRLETLVTKNSESIDRLETTVALVAKNSDLTGSKHSPRRMQRLSLRTPSPSICWIYLPSD